MMVHHMRAETFCSKPLQYTKRLNCD